MREKEVPRDANQNLSRSARRAWSSLLRATEIIAEVEKDIQTEAGISLDEFHVLHKLLQADKSRMIVGELAEAVRTTTGLSRPAVSRLADRLVAKGFAEKYEPASNKKEDGRNRWVKITTVGADTLVAAAPIYNESIRKNFSCFLSNTEATTLADLIGKVLDAPPART